MIRAIIVIALVMGIIIGGLLLLKRTSRMGVPPREELRRKRLKSPDELDEEDRDWRG